MFYRFIWKRDRVKRNVMVQDYSKGGLKMIDIRIMHKCCLLRSIKKLLSGSETPTPTCKKIQLYYFKKLGPDLCILRHNCSAVHVSSKDSLLPLPLYYRKLILTWYEMKPVQNVNDIEVNQVNWQLLWNNACISYKGNMLYFKKWIRRHILYVNDIVDNQGNFISFDDVKAIVGNDAHVLLQYHALINSIPKQWKGVSRLDNEESPSIKLCGKDIRLLDSIFFKNFCIMQYQAVPVSQNFWEKRFPMYDFRSISWHVLWKSPFLTTKEPKLISLQWKILHNIYPTKILLHKMRIVENNKCIFCDIIEYIEHFFFDCKIVKPLWDYVESLFSYSISLTVHDIIFGYNPHMLNKFRYINELLLVAKLSIVKYKSTVSSPNSLCQDAEIILKIFKSECILRNMI
ncbi:uncharacterized protein LOC118432322 [Branchiostoma floridae]|uniref:Uncharacterized protein LOC118432322 n=1 Tax=Branchiostoma floridae TaxID=7739 RepID=A0A9J7MEL4_BRAFL|nr:uncharacterized protein LOC118432322 [Branchiostoma floridae]